MNGIRIFVAVIFLLSGFSKLYSQKKIIEISNNFSHYPIGKDAYLFIDQQSFYKDSDLIDLSQFKLSKKDIPVMDVTTGNIWTRFTITNKTNDSTFFLSLPYSNISEISFFKLNGSKLDVIGITGNNYNF